MTEMKDMQPKIINWCPYQIYVYEESDKLWIHGSQTAKVLGFSPRSDVILLHVPSANKCFGRSLKSCASKMSKQEKLSLFIDTIGLEKLISRSNTENKAAFIGLLEKEIGFNYNIAARLSKKKEKMAELIRAFPCYSVKANYAVGDYLVDLYFVDEQIVVEYEEPGHKFYSDADEQKKREYIAEKLGCSFISLNPDEPDFSIFDVIGKIVGLLAKKAEAKI